MAGKGKYRNAYEIFDITMARTSNTNMLHEDRKNKILSESHKSTDNQAIILIFAIGLAFA